MTLREAEKAVLAAAVAWGGISLAERVSGSQRVAVAMLDLDFATHRYVAAKAALGDEQLSTAQPRGGGNEEG